MCGTCGCADPGNRVTMTVTAHGEETLLRGGPHDHSQEHLHDHPHEHPYEHGGNHRAHDDIHHQHGPNGETIALETAVLAKNDRIAARNRGWFEGRGVLALNFVSSPGAGKTSLLEALIRKLSGEVAVAVIEGDQMTSRDAERIRAAGARAVQINTGAGCHLEANMVARAVEALEPEAGSWVLIENVGNLVCPAMFDLGERMKVAVISTPEGEDKPLKYPHMFRAAELVLINKIDLAPYVGFDEALCRANIAEINPRARILTVSATPGAGLDDLTDMLRSLQTGVSGRLRDREERA